MSEISILTIDGVSFNLSDDKVRGSLSEVEMTPRASKTYAVGDYLIYQGRFYKVVQVIDQDSFFEIGTNIIPVTVGEELELKASLESPTFSGSPKVPTADVGTRTTQIASTAYVQSELDSVKERIQSVQNGLDGIDSNIGDRVTAVAASTTTAWMNAHITNTDSVLLDSSLTVEGAAADAKAVGDAIDELPKIVNTDEEGADFDLADSDGNVLVRFEDGHIKVKNFDSSTLSDSFNEKIDIQQDSLDVGKALVVGEDGKVSPADISIDVDTTLSIEGAVADAKAVGDALDALSDEIVDSIDTLSDELDSSINELDSSIDSRISSLNEDITNLQTGKQDVLTFDQTPTAESTNPVTSVGIKNAIEAAVDVTAPGIYETASGSIASFADGADDLPLKSCVVNIEPIQEGTGDPSPENVRPISGRTGLSVVRYGKNLLDDSIKFVTTTGTSLYIGSNSTDYHLYLPSGTYNFSCAFASNVRYAAYIKEENGSEITIWNKASGLTSKSFDLDGGNYRISFYNPAEDGGVSADSVSNIMLNVGDSALSYEPYKGNTYSVNWETEAGTIYGGYVDVVSGKLTVDYFKYSPLSTYTPSQYTSLGTYTRVAYSGASVKPGVNASLPYTGVYSHGRYSNQAWASDNSHAFCTDGGVGYFYLPCEADASAIQAYLKSQEDAGTPVTVAYKIATPTEIQLTPQEVRTLLRVNNVWSDAGSMAVEYPADTKLYINQKITEAIAAAMA